MRTSIGRAFRDASAPLAWYFAVAVAIPVLNGAAVDRLFVEHVAFVLAVPTALVALVGLVRPARATVLRAGPRSPAGTRPPSPRSARSAP